MESKNTNQDLFNNVKLYNSKVLEIMKNRYIIKLFLKGDGADVHGDKPKYMLIRNVLLLETNNGDIPKYALQGDDIDFLYGEYGKFGNGKQLTDKEYECYTSLFHSSGRIIFPDWISDWVIYKNMDDMENKIEDVLERYYILKLHGDIIKHNYVPKNHFGT